MIKRLLSVLVLFVFLTTVIAVAVSFPAGDSTEQIVPAETGQQTRLDFEVTSFTNNHDDATVVFPTSGSKTGLAFELPGSCLIQSATMDIEGQSYYTAASTFTSKDYSDRSDKKAWDAKNTSAPSNTNPLNLISSSETAEFSTTEYNAIDGDDGSGAEHSSSYSGPNPYHMFEIAVNKATTSYMNITWKGSAQSPSYYYYDTSAKIYVYYPSGHSWVQFDNVKCPGYDTTTKTTHFVVDRDYIYNNNLYIIVRGEIGSWGYPFIKSTYIKMRAYDRQPNFPTNPSLDLNSDSSQEWSATGALSSQSTFSGLNFQNTLQILVNGKTGPVDIPMTFNSQSMGILYASNISIKYKMNIIPTVNIIPSPIQILEDVGTYNTGIKLDGFISDDMGFNLLTLEAHGDSPETVDVQFNEDKIMIVTPADDFWGEVELTVSATDWGLNDVDEDGAGDDVTIYSNPIYIQVLPTDDPPTITDVNRKEPLENINRVTFEGTEAIYEDTTFTMYVNASDIDGDEVTLATNVTSRFDLQETETEGKWKIEYTPDYRDIGKKWFQLTATEKNNSVSPPKASSVDLIIEVLNVNDNPVIKSFNVEGDKVYAHVGSTTQVTVTEDTYVNITMAIFDEDGDYVVLDTNFTNMRFELDTIDGKIKFTPTQDDVGIHWIGFTLEDDNGGYTESALKMVVENVNDKPTNEGFTLATTSPGKPLNITLKARTAFDQDEDDLIYKWNFGDKTTGMGQETYHDYLLPDKTTTYTVSLIVSDGMADSPTVTETYEIKVEGGSIVVEGPTWVDPSEEWVEFGEDRYDTDGDGLPNWWEDANGMDKSSNNATDGNFNTKKELYKDELNNYEAWKKDQEPIVEPDDDDIATNDGKGSTGIIVVVIIAVFLVLIAIVAIVLLLVNKNKNKPLTEEEVKKENEEKKKAEYSNLYGGQAAAQQQPVQQAGVAQPVAQQQMPVQQQQQYLPPGQ